MDMTYYVHTKSAWESLFLWTDSFPSSTEEHELGLVASGLCSFTRILKFRKAEAR